MKDMDEIKKLFTEIKPLALQKGNAELFSSLYTNNNIIKNVIIKAILTNHHYDNEIDNDYKYRREPKELRTTRLIYSKNCTYKDINTNRKIKILPDLIEIISEKTVKNFDNKWLLEYVPEYPIIEDLLNFKHRYRCFGYLVLEMLDAVEIIDSKIYGFSSKEKIIVYHNLIKALETFAQCGFRQCDLNEFNIMVDRNTNVYIIDFGSIAVLTPEEIINYIDPNHLNIIANEYKDYIFSTCTLPKVGCELIL